MQQRDVGAVAATLTVDTTTSTLVFTLTDDGCRRCSSCMARPLRASTSVRPRPPSVVVTESSGSTDVTEGGATDNYSVALATQPTANVTVTLVSGAQATANPTSWSSRRPTGTCPRM